ncbi:MAG: RsmE family RNA methyltransferase [Planctomycetota bacterium]|nr:RsmE family RNA methyltransferase [Planctomycetota bacterium]
MSAPWVFVTQLPPSAPSTCRVDADEAKHAAGSRRLRTGDRMHLFDGRGVIADASMGAMNRDGSIDAEIDALRPQPPLVPMMEIASAVPKGDRLGTLLESIGPLGAARWTPLDCAHSVVKWSISHGPRARRVLISSCKQSHQSWLPQIAASCSPDAAVRDAISRGLQVFIAHPDGESISVAGGISSPATFLVGPEGGFTDAEVQAAEALGARRVSLGSAILRIELAVSCVLANVRLG